MDRWRPVVKMVKHVLQGLTNLATVTGHYERLAYAGLEANSQGCRDLGVLPNTMPGNIALDNEKGRSQIEAAWDEQLPTKAGKSYKQMLDAAGKGIKALVIMGANPATERPEWNANLDNTEFLVVQELFLTETAMKADVVLPAVSWAESDGTFTNVERRVQRAVKAINNPDSKAAPDWMILEHLATMMGQKWHYSKVQEITAEIASTVPFYADMTWENHWRSGFAVGC